jgi:hypothetical protein
MCSDRTALRPFLICTEQIAYTGRSLCGLGDGASSCTTPAWFVMSI